ncbi:hypothetical protein FNV43_RR20779 [Rhamnella rubrinervis]|uniref:FAD-binding PCMH-type domain-containing protein n=1 Tax=Rhamnella rubrinervis TaxID=2594499 RepID=A0A8K0DZE8_9ROSA|nr:hypothetical protein FNV43_RR20779 [Rhamnella rubrinervis]
MLMEKWRASRRFLRYSATMSLFDRILKPTSATSACNSAFDDRDTTLRTSMGTGIGSTVGLQHRCFGSAASKVQRNPLFSTLNSDDISYLKGVLGEKNVIQDEDRLMTANTDWMRKYRGSSKLLLQPRSTEEISQILKYCNSRCLAVVPQGGNTGLVGGSVPVFDVVVPLFQWIRVVTSVIIWI